MFWFSGRFQKLVCFSAVGLQCKYLSFFQGEPPAAGVVVAVRWAKPSPHSSLSATILLGRKNQKAEIPLPARKVDRGSNKSVLTQSSQGRQL